MRHWSARECRSRHRDALRSPTSAASYILRDLPAGSYAVTATASGRQPVHASVTVASGEVATLDIAMPRGPILLSSVIVSATRTPTAASNVASTVNVLDPWQ